MLNVLIPKRHKRDMNVCVINTFTINWLQYFQNITNIILSANESGTSKSCSRFSISVHNIGNTWRFKFKVVLCNPKYVFDYRPSLVTSHVVFEVSQHVTRCLQVWVCIWTYLIFHQVSHLNDNTHLHTWYHDSIYVYAWQFWHIWYHKCCKAIMLTAWMYG